MTRPEPFPADAVPVIRDLFAADEPTAASEPSVEAIAPDATLLRRFALAQAPDLLADVARVAALAGWRHMVTPGGLPMSVAMTNCGALGWISDRRGYRYDAVDPLTGARWPAMPPAFRLLAGRAAAQAGFAGFVPDACLVNRYVPGARLALHQDRDERDLAQPIVSVSLGLPAVFRFGGLARGDPAVRVPLLHGDVVVWGGTARLAFHGVLAPKDDLHPLTGRARINLTFRRAG